MQADAPATSRAHSSATAIPVTPRELFTGDGRIRADFRTRDWGGTPIGDTSTWSPALRSSLLHILWSAFPNMVLWGPDLVQLYNEPYLDLVGEQHGAGLGQPARIAMAEDWDVHAPICARVLAGETVSRENAQLTVTRAGRRENLTLTLSYAPIYGEHEVVAGVLITVFESEAELYGHNLH